ncbi:2-dehydro-3-deoxygalactonokinase [Sphingomonas metalli]|uniref:2-dehydro-3-deoxygalactonokinase n=1 Tax=Sphingomonas metalli TaxID=1779358 RepID=A0A916TCW5_9SPHN|nr:2-dehydro-3-deoxygalactonokinase [Sphingomonas metalli]GGB39277.1 2-dehydro-3-deoxygalactonokinase [Sphingomonas metalli]
MVSGTDGRGAEAGAYIAIDWGTTNRRAYLVAADGSAIDTMRDDRGVLAVAAGDYPAELAAIRARYGDLPVIAAGMVGSTRGWREAPYVPAPADAASLAAALLVIPEERCAIVPGLSLLAGPRADVMRGEEVQVLGAVAAGLAPADALFCQPGTHNKWVRTEGGRITGFATAMTGELFALVRDHGILAGMLDGPVADGEAFRAGVRRGAGAADLPVALFEVRAAVLLGRLAARDAAAHASGLLIGADVGAQALGGETVQLLADGTLAALYTAAIETLGGAARRIDSHAAFLAGIHQLQELRS